MKVRKQIQIVIEMDEKLYNYMQTEEYDKHLDRRFDYQIRFAVKDGTPLPKDHGRIVDISKIDKDRIESDNPVISLTVMANA